MVNISRKLTFFILIGAGIAFTGIGLVSIIDSYTPRFVEFTEIMKPNQTELFTPDMNSENIAKVYSNGSDSHLSIKDPNNKILFNKSNDNTLPLNETLKAKVGGVYKFEITNQGNETMSLYFGAFSKANPIAFGGQMMLIITGIVVIGLGLRTRLQS